MPDEMYFEADKQKVLRILNGFCPQCTPLVEMTRWGCDLSITRQECPKCDYRITGTPSVV